MPQPNVWRRLATRMGELVFFRRPDNRRYYGVYRVPVIDNRDPEAQGRVKVMLPWPAGDLSISREAWARLAPVTGSIRGDWLLPSVNDEVLVAFEEGDKQRPFVIGALGNGLNSPLEPAAEGNNINTMRSSRGLRVIFDDTPGQVKLMLRTPGGQTVALKDYLGRETIEVTDRDGNSVTMAPQGITVTSPTKVAVDAPNVHLTAVKVTVTAETAEFIGTVKANTVEANTVTAVTANFGGTMTAKVVVTESVVSDTYTPGAGNIW